MEIEEFLSIDVLSHGDSLDKTAIYVWQALSDITFLLGVSKVI